jgi:hypothetical protein
MITEGQVAHFNTFGFLILRNAFSSDEMETFTSEFEPLIETGEGNPDQAERGVRSVSPFIDKSPRLTELVVDDRIYGTIAQLLEPGFMWSGSEGQRGRVQSTWHADRPGVEELFFTRIKVHIYLDHTTKETGALRVIPGSQRLPYHDLLQPLINYHFKVNNETIPHPFGLEGADIPCYAVESNPGDIVFFNQSVMHAVYGGLGSQRRYIALKYADKPVSDRHVESLKKWSEYALHPEDNFLNSEDPRIRNMVEGLVELAQ